MRFLANDERWFLALCAVVLLTQAGRAVSSLAGGWWGPYGDPTPLSAPEGEIGLADEAAG